MNGWKTAGLIAACAGFLVALGAIGLGATTTGAVILALLLILVVIELVAD